MNDPVIRDPWSSLRQFTAARIGLGRSGDALPTSAVLEFSVAHAAARDAVHLPLDVPTIERDLELVGLASQSVSSQALDRRQYLKRPDLGRRLLESSHDRLRQHASNKSVDLVIVLADGLSALALQRHGVVVADLVVRRFQHWRIAPIVIATQARVALGDEVGEIMRAEFVVMLIGERPGLSSPDSLGIYVTRSPRVGCTDANRNCISNVRPQGLNYGSAVSKLVHLLHGARRLGQTGVALKDLTDSSGEALSIPPD